VREKEKNGVREFSPDIRRARDDDGDFFFEKNTKKLQVDMLDDMKRHA
jgi:hypothetical protein